MSCRQKKTARYGQHSTMPFATGGYSLQREGQVGRRMQQLGQRRRGLRTMSKAMTSASRPSRLIEPPAPTPVAPRPAWLASPDTSICACAMLSLLRPRSSTVSSWARYRPASL